MSGHSLEYYRGELRAQAAKDYREVLAEMTNATNQQIAAEKQAIDLNADNKVAEQQARGDVAVKESRPIIDAAAVQQLVDEQNAKERMANLGLAQSGTQAAALHGADNRRATTEQQTHRALKAVMEDISRNISTIYTKAEANKALVSQDLSTDLSEDAAALWKKLMKQADANALSAYKSDQSVANTRAKLIASIDAQLLKKTNGAYGLSSTGTVEAR